MSKDGRATTSEQEIANDMNVFFTEVGHELSTYLKPQQDDNVNKLKTLLRNEKTLFRTPVSEGDVLVVMEALDIDKKVGYDGISAFMLKKM